MRSVIKLGILLATMLGSLWSLAQAVHVAPVKGGVVLSVSAQKPYPLLPGMSKLPQLGVECIRKGSKSSHTVIFWPGGSVVADDIEPGGKGGQGFAMTIDGNKEATPWSSYGDSGAFAYFAKTEPERVRFLQTVLNAKTVSIDFKSFLTGASVTSTFDLSALRDAVQKQPDCAMK